MKAISLHQPWASAIAFGLKNYETRSWPTSYRGRILIHAAKRRTRMLELSYLSLLMNPVIRDRFQMRLGDGYCDFRRLPLGVVVCSASIVNCVEVSSIRDTLSPTELSLGDYTAGRFAWQLEDVRVFLDPFPFVGRQGFFDIPDSALVACSR